MQEYERNGLELVAIPEAYSFDAVSRPATWPRAPRSSSLMSAIFQIYTRTPSLTAMTAAGLDFVSGGRFTLGLGASGPQVIEGFHGVRYDAPLGRTREVIDVCRQVWKRQPVEYRGKHYTVPLTKEDGGSGLGKPLKIINHPVRPDIPVSVAALGPKNVALVAETRQRLAAALLPPPQGAAGVGESLEEGFAKRDPALGELDIQSADPVPARRGLAGGGAGDPQPGGAARRRDGRARQELLQPGWPAATATTPRPPRSRTSTSPARRRRRRPPYRTTWWTPSACSATRTPCASTCGTCTRPASAPCC
ncbi:LLM class flavin-dependent oxidoreductase [Nocardioides convexus]|uniref:LLM class flavin-dependent oxidoreductase n=1 Tax=Nocardioides convexus TaxID=2712224 RepID=UPI00241821EC|nr:LLM class flavin-dependent oxidoreductase [Nocardioides convexus]